MSARMEKTLAQRVTDLGEKLFDTCEALHAALSDAPAADGGIDARTVLPLRDRYPHPERPAS